MGERNSTDTRDRATLKKMDFTTVFQELKGILLPYGERLVVVADTDKDYHLNTSHVMKNKKPLFFAAAQIQKNYVSYHLMPIYVNPELLSPISVALRKRMQGKSCFNFSKVDISLFEELQQLTQFGFEDYVSKGYI
ncbi:hypothetical protein [Lusitaniella coriacea]|nr:hypothetical protein [Lusitaniella coriacea]